MLCKDSLQCSAVLICMYTQGTVFMMCACVLYRCLWVTHDVTSKSQSQSRLIVTSTRSMLVFSLLIFMIQSSDDSVSHLMGRRLVIIKTAHRK